jgi:HAD superfamily hydrolase (TIGR01509 family)
MIRAVIFDFNGILADDDPIHMQALLRVVQEEGLTFTTDEYMEHYLPLNDQDCFRRLWETHDRALSPTELKRLIDRKSDYYFSAIDQRNVMFEGAAGAVRAAASRGPVAIASGASIGEIRHILSAAGLLECFKTIVAAEDVKHGKPDPEPFQLAFARLKQAHSDLSHKDCVAVEDSLGGIRSAQAAGIACLGVAHSYPQSRLAEAKPQWMIDSISDFEEWLKGV